MRKFIAVILIEAKMFFRTGIAVFFTFVFPFLLLFFFGSIWGKRFIPYLVPMLIAMVSSSSGIYSIGIILPNYRESGILKRITVSPLRGWTYIYGLITARFFIAFSQSLIIVLVAKFSYGIEMKGSLLLFLIVVFLGTMCMLSIGGLIAGISKNSEVATTIANLTFTPLMFLSGAFIPIFVFPKFFQKLAQISPVYHFIKLLQDILIHEKGFKDGWMSLLVLFLSLLAFFIITKKTFREQ